ncbi:MAG TPA: phosphoribosylglycinamide formyltransferase [Flavobacterium sp.]|nr:phosphoribosylglycinamide formyltransferase [Flavobacterium sp.]
MKKIILFASGSGSNAVNIINYFNKRMTAVVATVFCNNAQAKVIEKASDLGVPTVVFTKEELEKGKILHDIDSIGPDLIVLAGFLLKFPPQIVSAYQNKIINIHPALLPKYGGKGMYGMNVHRAVLENKDSHSGISIHLVNENYDEGALIFQSEVLVGDCREAEEIAAKVQELEQQFFPKVIEDFLNAAL